ncbi:hypothetical protein BDV95DRAFT_610216 [Massariosphaeria phaeospora]|uniref:BCS1 N-terminal domain-containing protein n=1 Tax=Massariosphaeria phaeospora TaxID=100035 RepID=A0A7C8I1E2_9PLEO|nr:hypothetical protein BDV95DRAFT_610216 [Massariosphaeria phaeospora]
MDTALFQAVRSWVKESLRVDIAAVIWAITVLIPLRKYSATTLRWVRDHGMNAFQIQENDALASDLVIWISNQPTSHLFSWLPTFEHLEWRDFGYHRRTKNPETKETHEIVAADGYTLSTKTSRLC